MTSGPEKFSVRRISGGFPDGTDGFSDIRNPGNFRKCGIAESGEIELREMNRTVKNDTVETDRGER